MLGVVSVRLAHGDPSEELVLVCEHSRFGLAILANRYSCVHCGLLCHDLTVPPLSDNGKHLSNPVFTGVGGVGGLVVVFVETLFADEVAVGDAESFYG
jgi:hypothetical protein